jgi:hypothetical protein
MNVCVYTTNHPLWLHHMRDHCTPSDLVCFRSNQRWAAARHHLRTNDSLPLLIRETKDDTESFLCTFLAELVELWFPKQFGNDAERRAWLDEKLWLQRDGWKAKGQNWQEQFQAREIERFMKAETYYIIRDLRPIEPLPLSKLVKVSNGEALAQNYIRGYAICYFPASEVRTVQHTTV